MKFLAYFEIRDGKMKIPKPKKKTITKSPRRKSEISQKVAKQVGEIINFARFLCTLESFGHIKKKIKKIFIPILTFPLLPSVTVIGSEASKNAVLHCFALFFDVFSCVEASPVSILRRCFIDVIFEVSNAKRKLEIQNLNSKI